MTALELQLTERLNGHLTTRTSRFPDPESLLAVLPSLPPALPTFVRISRAEDDSPLVYLMCDPRNYHLSLWRNSEEWAILVNPSPSTEHCEVGWDIYAGWATNSDFAAAREAIREYVLRGVVVPHFEWRWDSA